jgi:hypothetical protein
MSGRKKKNPIGPFALPTVVAALPEIQLASHPTDLVPPLLHLQPSRPVTTTGIPLSLSLVHHRLFMAVLGLEGLLGWEGW